MGNDSQAGLKRRTRGNAEAVHDDLGSVPKHLALITHDTYQSALLIGSQGLPRLQPINPAVKLTFDNGELRIDGAVASKAQLVNLFTNEKVSAINVPLLQSLFTVLFQKLREDLPGMNGESELQNYTVTLYLPELLSRIGMSYTDKEKSNTNQNQINCYIRQMKEFSALLGIMPVKSGGRVYDNEYPVMLFHGLDRATNCIRFSSPYMNRVVRAILEDQSRPYEKDGKQVYTAGKPVFKPPVSNLVKMNIVTAKNRRAIEVVNVIAVLLETCGSRKGVVPNKRVDKIIEKCPDLKQALEAARGNPAQQNMILRRAFSGAWDYIDKYTYIRECFKNIQIPDTIPTSNALNQVLRFPHEGKKSPKGAEEEQKEN